MVTPQAYPSAPLNTTYIIPSIDRIVYSTFKHLPLREPCRPNPRATGAYGHAGIATPGLAECTQPERAALSLGSLSVPVPGIKRHFSTHSSLRLQTCRYGSATKFRHWVAGGGFQGRQSIDVVVSRSWSSPGAHIDNAAARWAYGDSGHEVSRDWRF